LTVLGATTCGLTGVGEGGRGVEVAGTRVSVGVGGVVGVKVAVGGTVAVGMITTAVGAAAGVKVGAGVRVVRTMSLLTLKNQANRAVAPR
jgi:hypothetical protein